MYEVFAVAVSCAAVCMLSSMLRAVVHRTAQCGTIVCFADAAAYYLLKAVTQISVLIALKPVLPQRITNSDVSHNGGARRRAYLQTRALSTKQPQIAGRVTYRG
jgi:hypothetical protein